MPLLTSSTRFSLVPLFWLSSAFALGILAASLIDFGLFIGTGISVICAILASLFRRHSAATVLMVAAFVLAGAVAYTAEIRSVRPDRIKVLYDSGTIPSGESVEIEGVLKGSPEAAAEGEFLTVVTDRLRHRTVDRMVTGKVRLFLPHSGEIEPLRLKHGSRVVIQCILEREDEYLNPGVIRRTQLLDQLGIDAGGAVKSSLLIEHIADESVFLPLAWVYDQRARLIDDLNSALSPSAAGVMTASLLGGKHFLDRDTAEVFREGGTFHVLVISGLHITFIGGILLLVVRSLTRNRWAHFYIPAIFLWAYTLAVGADVPVVRAAVMFTVVLFSYVIYRPANLLNSLGLCVLSLVAWRPSDLFNPSFQLTVVSVAAIIAIAYPLIDGMRRIGSWTPTAKTPFPPDVPDLLKRICETLYWNEEAWQFERKRQIWSAGIIKSPYMAGRLSGPLQKVLRYLTEGVLVSLIVQICMLPLLVVYFHRVSIVSIVLNLWVGFFIAVESFAVVLVAILKGISPLMAVPLFALADAVNWVMLLLPRAITGYWWSGFRSPVYSGPGRLVYFLYLALIAVLAFGISRWDPMKLGRRIRPVFVGDGLAALVLFLVIVFHPFSAPRPDGRLKIDFLDVGQGDAALVTFPDGQTMLVDGGGRMRFKRSNDDEGEPFEPDVRRLGESVVSEFLWERGYSRMDYILATHSDADHMQGLADVAKNFRIGHAMIGPIPTDDPEYDELKGVLESRAVKTTFISAGHSLNVGGVTIDILYPPENIAPDTSPNDTSVVLRLTYGERVFLLTGDIEARAESHLISSGIELFADVIKVPHHGSRTSSTAALVDSIKPQIAVIPVGRRSYFGHPHREVVDRWHAAGADVRTTGEKGMVTVSTDGNDLAVSTYVP